MDDPARLLLTNAAAAGLVALLAWAASLTVRRQSVVHGLWLLALARLVVPPIAPLPLVPAGLGFALSAAPAAPIVVTIPPVAGAREPSGAVISRRTPASESRSARLREPEPLPASARPVPAGFAAASAAGPASPAGSNRGWPGWAGVAWLSLVAGALAIPLLTAWRFARFERLLAHARPGPVDVAERVSRLAARLGLRRAPPVLLVPARIPPMLWPHPDGPRLLLPAALLPGLRDDELDALLAHELAHVRRRDHWVRLVEIAATSIFWWYPVTWWVRRALRRAEERCCDEWVLRLMPRSAEAYANGLLKSLTFVSGASLPAVASGAGPVEDLEARLKEILMTRPVPQLATPLRLALAAAAAFGLAVFPTHAQTNATQNETPPPAVAATPATAAEAPHALTPRPAAAPRPARRPVATTPAVVAGVAGGVVGGVPGGVAVTVPAPAPVAALASAPQAPPLPAVAPVAPTTPISQPAPAPAIAAGSAHSDSAHRAFDDQRRAIEEQRRQLHQQELELERRQIELDAQAEQTELRAEADRLRAEGKAEDALRVEKQGQLSARRVELQRRQLQLEVERAVLEAKQEAEARTHEEAVEALEQGGRGSEAQEARQKMELADAQREQAEQELEKKQQAIEKEMAEADAQMQVLAAEEQVSAARDATDELARSLGEQIESLKQAAADAPAQKAGLEHEIQRLQAALEALQSSGTPKALPRKTPRP
jgi:beta-lactamase regulating signal transducer with metallopeptidase domain